MSEVVVLDVAHGNCTLVRSAGAHCIVDAPLGSLLLNTLEDLGITSIDVAFVSHADRDHLGGIVSLLTSKTVRLKKLYVNPDSQKNTKIWRDFRAAVSVAEQQGSCEVVPSLTTTMPGSVLVGDVSIHVEAPSASFALAGSGGMDDQGRKITSNSISALLRLQQYDVPRVLLAGDIDVVGLDDAVSHQRDLKADTLVFPHHGGRPSNSDPAGFAGKLIEEVKPSLVIFSNGRAGHDNPRREIVRPVVESGCAVACTQLAKNCSSTPIFASEHLENLRAQGRSAGRSCGGSMTIDLAGTGTRHADLMRAHQTFVDRAVGSPMCRD